MTFFGRFFENISWILSQIRIWDILDMLLVWLIVYRILLLIRQTRAIQMLSGLGILAITYVSSHWLDLYTIKWLLENFFDNLFVIVVVLFQNEIRKALAHIGRNPFFSGVSAIEETQVIEELAKSAIQLAQRGYGALIVIEREMGLEEFIEIGTNLDASVSSELLSSIFLPSSPLHDGAVIIRGGRIRAAGCFLPLTKSPQIDKNLGTRHRAAIGLTEETDAIVIVVSEENNFVSIVEAGQMSQDLDHKTLRKFLYDAFQMTHELTLERGATP
jgi:diadenylate cyclase